MDMVLSEIDDLLTGTMTNTKPPSKIGDDKSDKKAEDDTKVKAPVSQPVLVVARPENDDQSSLPKQVRRQEQEPSEAVLAEIRALLAR